MNLAFDIDPGVLACLRQAPEEFLSELRLAAAVKWYEQERISQGRAAEIASLSRADFIGALGRYGVTPFQQTGDELLADLVLPEQVQGPGAWHCSPAACAWPPRTHTAP